jgi:hypothetical protein
MAGGHGSGRRGARAVAKAVLAVVALGLIVVVAAPLVLRGRILSHLVEHLSKDLCGSVALEGGHFSAGTVPALIFQRPFEVALDGIHIREPDGQEFFAARTVRLKLTVLYRPWRVVIERALVADGTWRMASRLGEQTTVALRSIPPGGRAECRAPAPPSEGPSRQGSFLTLREARLQNVSVVLSFPSWAVSLDSVSAHGSLEVRGAPEATQFLFDARDVLALRGGLLRVGPAGEAMTPEVPFDRVSIPRVAVTDPAPENLLLEVEGARTGPAVLAGKAVFTNVFAPDSWQVESGMELEAGWIAIGEALARSPAWAAVGERLAKLKTGLRTSLHGPFEALTGSAALDGKGIAIQARLMPQRRYRLDVAFDHLDTGPLLPAGQRTRFGGRLDGQLSVTAEVGGRRKDLVISLDTIELALSRPAASGQPRRIVVTRRVAEARSPSELRVGLGVVALRDEVLRIDPLRVQAPGVTVAGRLRAQRDRGSDAFLLSVWTESPSSVSVAGETFVPPPFIGARFDPGRALSIEPFSIQRAGGGVIGLGGSIRFDGPIDLRATVSDYPLAHIPGLARARAPGRTGASIGRLLGGRLDASFKVGGSTKRPALSGELSLLDVRWAAWPLGGGRVTFSEIRGGTRFDGQVLDGISVRGEMHARPRAKDFVALALRGVPLAPWLPHPAAALALQTSGEVVWHPAAGVSPMTTTADLAVRGHGVEMSASMQAQPARRTAAVRGRIALAEVRAAFPALRLRQAKGVITTDVRVSAEAPTGTLQIDGAIAVTERLQVWPISSPAMIAVPPSTIELHGNEVRVPGLAVITSGAQATLAGTLRVDWADRAASALEGRLRVLVDGRGLGPWLPARSTGSGTATLDMRLAGTLGAPRLRGRADIRALILNMPGSPSGPVRIDGPLEFDGRTVLVGPLTARFANGGWLEIAGPAGPGRLVLAAGRSPLPLSAADLTVRGAGLTTTRPLAGLTVRDLALGLRLTTPRADIVQVVGEVRLGHLVYRLKQDEKDSKTRTSRQPSGRPAVLDRVWVQLRIDGPEDAVMVDVPYVPDVTVGVRCAVEGPLSAPRVWGHVQGDGAYSKLALALADGFTGRALRACDLAPK